MKAPHPISLAGLVLAVTCWVQPPVVGLSLDKTLTVDQGLYDALVSVLETGVYRDGSVSADLSGIQNVAISNGVATFNPPARVRWKFISSTITEIGVKQNGKSILVDIDSSPIDIRLKPR